MDLQKKAVLILLNFVLTFPSAVIAVLTKIGFYFHGHITCECLVQLLEYIQMGLFLETGSKLMNMDATYLGLLLSIAVYVVVLTLSLLINNKRSK